MARAFVINGTLTVPPDLRIHEEDYSYMIGISRHALAPEKSGHVSVISKTLQLEELR